MTDTKISALPSATTPLAGTEVLPIVQSSATKQVSVANLTAGRAISAAGITDTTLSASSLVFTDGSKKLTSTGTIGVTQGGTGTTTAFTTGSVVFAGASGVYTQDNANFFWDDTNNRLGIGTAVPAYTVDISGVLNTNSGATIRRYANTKAQDNGLILGTVAKGTASSGGAGAFAIVSDDASNYLEGVVSLFTSATAGSRRLIIEAIEQGVAYRNVSLAENGGNVGIGNASPTAKLDVTGTAAVSSTFSAAGITDSTLTASKGVFTDASKRLTSTGTLGVDQGGTGTTTAFTAGSIVFAGTSGVYSQKNANLFWDNTNNRLGVGTATPAFTVEIASAYNNGIQLKDTTSTVYGGLFVESGVMAFGTRSNHPLRFITNDSDRGRFTAAGRFLVGVNTDIAVDATTTAGFQVNRITGLCEISRSGGDPLALQRTTSDGNIVSFWRQTTNVGSISVTTTNTAYNTSSDYRLKDNVRPLKGGLGRVMQLNPCEWEWKANGQQGVGFIAHEVQELRPQAVTGEKDAVDDQGKPIYQGIDASFLIADLTAAIQELKSEIDALKAALAKT